MFCFLQKILQDWATPKKKEIGKENYCVHKHIFTKRGCNAHVRTHTRARARCNTGGMEEEKVKLPNT